MLEIASLAIIAFIGLAIVLVGLGLLFALKKGVKKGAAAATAAGHLLVEAEHHLRGKGELTHGQIFDQVEAIGNELVSGGYMTDADWQPIFEQVAKALTHKSRKLAPPAAEEASA